MKSSEKQESFPAVNLRKNGVPHHASGYRIHQGVLKIVALIACAGLFFAGSITLASYLEINHLVKKNAVKIIAQDDTPQNTPQTPKPKLIEDLHAGKAVQFLLIGQDTRTGPNAEIGGTEGVGLHNADTTIVAQISADRSFVNLVSIPRDSLVDVPSCRTSRRTIPARRQVMFNSIFAYGFSAGGDLASAASCTLHAVNAISGLQLDNFIVADFNGVKNMVDALGGIDLCIPLNLSDSYTGLVLNRGLQHLDGYKATQYARMRHGINVDGSDIARTTRQQYLLKTVARKALSTNLLTQPSQIYQLAKSALSSLSFSSDLANLDVLAGLAVGIRHLQPSRVYAQTIPIIPAPGNPNRVVLAPQAKEVWEKMRQGLPLTNHLSPTATQSSQQDSPSSTTAIPDPNASQNSSNADGNSGSTNQGTGSNGTSTNTPGIAQNSQQGANTTSSTVQADTFNGMPIDPNTGLYLNKQGQLIDPTNGGWVDTNDGSIRDFRTGAYLGFAEKYINFTVCGIRQTN